MVFFLKLNMYEIFKPIFCCSFICGMTPFSIRGTQFQESKWPLLWNSIIIIVCTTLCSIAFASRTFERKKILIYSITDFMQAWLSALNVICIIVIECLCRKKVSVLSAAFVYLYVIKIRSFLFSAFLALSLISVKTMLPFNYLCLQFIPNL